MYPPGVWSGVISLRCVTHPVFKSLSEYLLRFFFTENYEEHSIGVLNWSNYIAGNIRGVKSSETELTLVNALNGRGTMAHGTTALMPPVLTLD